MSSTYRQKCLDAMGDECDHCGSTERIEVHHRDGDRTNDDLSNLLPLCKPHHVQLHRGGLDGFEDELLPLSERPQLDQSKTAYQISTDREKWEAWKETVPRSKSLETRIIELIEADTEGRVIETEDDE